MLEDLVNRSQAPGVSMAVVSGDQIVATAGGGFADVDSGLPMSVESACNWFSMTKIATATAVMMLVDRGELDLDAPVSSSLGDAWPREFAAVTVRHLLGHSSGLRNPLPIRWVHRTGEPRPDQHLFLARLLRKQRKPRFAPGARAAYTNVGYLALGVLIEEVAGRSYEAFVREELLAPLGMSHTAFQWDDPALAGVQRTTGYQPAARLTAWSIQRLLPAGILGSRSGSLVALHAFEVDGAAYGGLIGPVTDAARLLALHCNEGECAGRRLLSADLTRAMSNIVTPGKPYDLGLGWFRPTRERGPHVEHLGGGMGYWNLLRMDPTNGQGVAIMSNITTRWNIADTADEAAAATLGTSSEGETP